MEISNKEYLIGHGKNPRGRGVWGFAAKRYPDFSEIFWFNGNLTEAKKEAAKHFRGKSTIYVMP